MMKNYESNEQKLPMFGIGPYLILSIGALALIGIACSNNVFSSGVVLGKLQIIYDVFGILLIFLGIWIWYVGAIKSGLEECIKNNQLKTDGIYAWTRNPIYTGWWFFIIGITLLWHNYWLLFIIPIQWLILTLGIYFTEEKWLGRVYGETYREYCRHVHRLIPMKITHLL